MAKDKKNNQHTDEEKIQETRDKFLKDYNKKRKVETPDGQIIEVDPMKDYFSQERPERKNPHKGVIEKFLNWARSESIWVLGFGTGCGSIEIPDRKSTRLNSSHYS